jgi:hypothetical protein
MVQAREQYFLALGDVAPTPLRHVLPRARQVVLGAAMAIGPAPAAAAAAAATGQPGSSGNSDNWAAAAVAGATGQPSLPAIVAPPPTNAERIQQLRQLAKTVQEHSVADWGRHAVLGTFMTHFMDMSPPDTVKEFDKFLDYDTDTSMPSPTDHALVTPCHATLTVSALSWLPCRCHHRCQQAGGALNQPCPRSVHFSLP